MSIKNLIVEAFLLLLHNQPTKYKMSSPSSYFEDITLYRSFFGNKITPILYWNLIEDVPHFKNRIFITSFSKMNLYIHHDLFLNTLTQAGFRIKNIDEVQTRTVEELYQLCFEEPLTIPTFTVPRKLTLLDAEMDENRQDDISDDDDFLEEGDDVIDLTSWIYERLSKCNEAFWTNIDNGRYYDASVMLKLMLLINKTKFIKLDCDYTFNDINMELQTESFQLFAKMRKVHILDTIKKYHGIDYTIFSTDTSIIEDNDNVNYKSFLMNLTDKTYIHLYKDALSYLNVSEMTPFVYENIADRSLEQVHETIIPLKYIPIYINNAEFFFEYGPKTKKEREVFISKYEALPSEIREPLPYLVAKKYSNNEYLSV
ncbi:DhNV_043 [Dikerogammarus haemobaphes nudivirus]|nr:DhNV_043 [Dikerogammarus haemobaphes nudivirus]